MASHAASPARKANSSRSRSRSRQSAPSPRPSCSPPPPHQHQQMLRVCRRLFLMLLGTIWKYLSRTNTLIAIAWLLSWTENCYISDSTFESFIINLGVIVVSATLFFGHAFFGAVTRADGSDRRKPPIVVVKTSGKRAGGRTGNALDPVGCNPSDCLLFIKRSLRGSSRRCCTVLLLFLCLCVFYFYYHYFFDILFRYFSTVVALLLFRLLLPSKSRLQNFVEVAVDIVARFLTGFILCRAGAGASSNCLSFCNATLVRSGIILMYVWTGVTILKLISFILSKLNLNNFNEPPCGGEGIEQQQQKQQQQQRQQQQYDIKGHIISYLLWLVIAVLCGVFGVMYEKITMNDTTAVCLYRCLMIEDNIKGNSSQNEVREFWMAG